MGVTLESKKGKISLDMGYGGFLSLRKKVAELCSPEFGKHYDTIDKAPFIFGREEYFKKFDIKTEELLKRKVVSPKVVDFCLQSDREGRIHYGACKEIYKHIKDYDDDFCYGYAGRPDCTMFRDFKNLLKECIDNKCDLVWW